MKTKRFFVTTTFFAILNVTMIPRLLIILCLLFFTAFFSQSNYAAGFLLDISVPRVSKFQLIQFHKKIQHGDNIIGQFILENNTIDGFKLEISSPTNGHLSPESTNDGDISIPYTLSIEKRTGDVAPGVVVNETPDLSLGIPINIIDS